MADTIASQWFAANPYQPPKPKPKQKGRGGTATSLISEGAALAGGVVGVAAAPFTGGASLIAAPAAFSTVGRLVENKIRDDRWGASEAAQEGALTGILGGFGKGLKASAAAGKAVSQGKKLEDILATASDAALSKGKGFGATGKVQQAAADRSAKGFGIKTDDKLLPDEADEIANFVRTRANTYAPVKPGAPLNQARDLQKVKNGVVEHLDNALSSINRPLKPNEVKQISAALDNRLINDPDITGTTALAAKFKTLIANKDVKGLEQLRRKYDDIGWTSADKAGNTAKAAEARAIRDTIDEFVTPLSKDYKTIKGDYSLANKALKLASKEGGKAQNGISPPFTGGGLANRGIGGNVIATGRNKLAGKMAGMGVPGAPDPTRTGLKIGAQGATLESLLTSQNPNNADMTNSMDPNSDMTNTAMSNSIDETYQNEEDLSSQQETSPYTRENLMADIQRDPKNASKYIDTYTALQEIFATATAGGQLNSTASGVIADTSTGLNSLAGLSGAIAQSGANNPGIGQLRSFNPFDTEAKQLQAKIATAKQIVGKALEGGVLRKEDEYKYAKILPTMGDTDAVAEFKIQELQKLISQRLAEYKANIKNGGTIEDSLLMAYQ